MIKWNDVKQALKDAKNSNYFRLMANYETGEAWCDRFENSDSWKNYTNESIFFITSGYGDKSIKLSTEISETDLINLLNAFPDKPQSPINDAGVTQLQDWQHDVEEYFQNKGK